jgi:hypothetical protein
MSTTITTEQIEAVREIVQSAAKFRRAFSKGFTEALLAEFYAAQHLHLSLCEGNAQGYDAVGPAGERYQVKFRSVGTLNVDVNNFDFDFLVLVNLDDDLSLAGLWLIGQDEIRSTFAHRPDFRKFQITQSKLKGMATKVV